MTTDKSVEDKMVKNSNKKATVQEIEVPADLIDERFSTAEIMNCIYQEEVGDSELYQALHRGKFCYDNTSGEWFYFNDGFWRFDIMNQSLRAISEVAGIYHNEIIKQRWIKDKAKSIGNDDAEAEAKAKIKVLSKRFKGMCNLSRMNRVRDLSKEGINSLGVAGDEWDKNPYMLAVKNGVIDLKKGDIRKGDPNDFLQTACGINFEKEDPEKRKIWFDFLVEVFDSDFDKIDYLKRLLGYCLIGECTEHIFPILWGKYGRNGKSTIMEIVNHILGDFAYRMPSDYLLINKLMGSNHDVTKVALRGVRFCWISETNKGDRLDSAKVKELTGGDTITARAPYARRDTIFTPTHTMFMITNSSPNLPFDDSALWSRILRLEFPLSFVDNPDPDKPWERKAKKGLIEEFKKISPHILCWMIEGCQDYLAYGINPPESVTNSTKMYRESEDPITEFVSECCFIDDDNRETPKNMFDAYKLWCLDDKQKPMRKKDFNEELKKSFKLVKSGQHYYQGLTLNTSYSEKVL